MDRVRRFVNQLMPGEMLDQVFLVRDKDLRTTRGGDLYIVCTLCDRTGTVPARMWQAGEAIFNSIPVDGFLHVKGRTEDYRGALQFVIDACRPFPAERADLADFLPTTAYDVEAMWEELLEILRAIRGDAIRMLLKKFFEDRALVEAFKKAPAAMQMHHPFLGGLLEHTLAVARAARALLPLYPALNADLVLAGAFLHDVGKAAELTSGTSIAYTERGQLVGHITIAAIWVGEKAAALSAETGQPFPADTLNLLQHLILSHHGEHEYGSPKLPAVPEAFFLHYLDNLDAKMYMTFTAIANDPDPNAAFTAFHRDLQVRLYKRGHEGHH